MMFVKHTGRDPENNSITFIGFDRIETDDDGNITLYDAETGLRFCDIAISRAFRAVDLTKDMKGKAKAFLPKATRF